MKKIGTWIFGILGVLYLIGVIFGGNESNTSKNNVIGDKPKTLESSVKERDQEVLAKKYNNLPVKQNLSYFITPRNIFVDKIQGVHNKDDFNYYFHINKDTVSAFLRAKINSKGFSEFETDDFEKKLKTEFTNSLPDIKNDYKIVDKHIRIIDL